MSSSKQFFVGMAFMLVVLKPQVGIIAINTVAQGLGSVANAMYEPPDRRIEQNKPQQVVVEQIIEEPKEDKSESKVVSLLERLIERLEGNGVLKDTPQPREEPSEVVDKPTTMTVTQFDKEFEHKFPR